MTAERRAGQSTPRAEFRAAVQTRLPSRATTRPPEDDHRSRWMVETDSDAGGPERVERKWLTIPRRHGAMPMSPGLTDTAGMWILAVCQRC